MVSPFSARKLSAWEEANLSDLFLCSYLVVISITDKPVISLKAVFYSVCKTVESR